MVANNKVLTVSYGTFSCTLEGFEDSFDTMKAIAEYFRDLAADDRYFGAEPPQPDADVLARIAERELSRMVHGRTEGNAVVLSPIDQNQDAPVRMEVAVPPQTVPDAAPVSTDAPARAPEPEPVAAPPEPVAPPAAAQAPQDSAPQAITESPAAASQPVAPDPVSAPVAVAAKPTPPAVKSAPLTLNKALADPTLEPEPATVEHSIDDDLEELRALSVARQKAAETEPAQIRKETVAEKMRRLNGLAAASPEHSDDVPKADVAKSDVAKAKAEPDPVSAPVSDSSAASSAAPVSTPDSTVDADVQTATPDTQVAAQAAAADVPPQDTPLQTETPPRVVKLKKADLDRLLAEPQSEQPVQTAPATAATDLDGLDEFVSSANMDVEVDPDLMAKIQADIGETKIEEPQPRRSKPQLKTTTDEEDLNRILRQTNAELNSEEHQDRREAFENMKAAVAAADETETDDTDQGAEDAFRKDLAQVVQPRRSQPADAAPLKLVASQRVETPAADPDPTPVPASPQKPESFGEYLAQTGAVELNDVLEVAAAYTAFVEGNSEFSRPQVMRKVSSALPQDFTREDCLRVFGQLLRNGTLQRKGGGNFAIDPNSRFHPEHRAAG